LPAFSLNVGPEPEISFQPELLDFNILVHEIELLLKGDQVGISVVNNITKYIR
jgi:hypothetical protein